MELDVKIEYLTSIEELIDRYSGFNFLKKVDLKNQSASCWNINDKPSFEIQVLFLGKTGYGKSTTINRLVGKNVLETSDIEVCTKALHSVEYQINESDFYFSFNDFPGIGEDGQADIKYVEWYKEMLGYSHCVVYILRADQRDYALDEALFHSLFPQRADREKVIIALNFADKVEPINRLGEITEEQKINLQRKIRSIKRLFGTSEVMYYSALDEINFNILVSKIIQVVKREVKTKVN